MSRYSFLDELIIAEGIVSDLGKALSSHDASKAYEACREMRNSAARLMRKIKDYDAFYEYIENIAPGTKAVSFIEFDAIAENGKETCSDTSQSCGTCKHQYSPHCEKCLLNPYSRWSPEACVNCYTPIQ